MTIDLRTGQPVTRSARAAHKALKTEDREIRTQINARALRIVGRIIENAIVAGSLAPRKPRFVRRRTAEA